MAVKKGQLNEAAFWRQVLLERTISIVNLITNAGTTEAGEPLREGDISDL